MQFQVATFVVTFLVFIKTARNCLFTPDPNQKIQRGYWDETSHSRKYSPFCSCGGANATWLVYVHSGVPPERRLCIGTIITQNLVATSHRCITRKDTDHLNIYDSWEPGGGRSNVADKKHIWISLNKELNDSTLVFPVTNVVINPFYAMDVSTQQFPNDDMLLLKVGLSNRGTTMIQEKLTPICLTHPYNTRLYQLYFNNATFYTLSRKVEVAKHQFQDVNGIGDDEVVRTEEVGVILDSSDCNGETLQGDAFTTVANYTMCIRLTLSVPMIEGGPLVMFSKVSTRFGEKVTAFLMGINSWIDNRHLSSGYRYVYFTNVVALAKYVERHADHLKSEWCETPAFKLPDNQIQSATHGSPWGWGRMEATSLQRNEVLDCECGIERDDDHEEQAEEHEDHSADPYKYRWMVLIKIWGGMWKCSGSIINDRVILTAAHCTVNAFKPANLNESAVLKPRDFRVFASIHNADEKVDRSAVELRVSKVLYHPEYLLADRYGGASIADIALLILETPLTFQNDAHSTISPICIPLAKEDFEIPFALARVAGWRINGYDQLMQVTHDGGAIRVPVSVGSICREEANNFTANELYICALSPDFDEAAYLGNSGGPMWFVEPNSLALQIGVASTGKVLRTIGFVNIFTNVQAYTPFIEYHSKMVGAKWCKFTPQNPAIPTVQHSVGTNTSLEEEEPFTESSTTDIITEQNSRRSM